MSVEDVNTLILSLKKHKYSIEQVITVPHGSCELISITCLSSDLESRTDPTIEGLFARSEEEKANATRSSET